MDKEITPAIQKRTKRSLPREASQRYLVTRSQYAYTLTDTAYGEFNLLPTANAWWGDKSKVTKLLDAYKFECTDLEAIGYIGISPEQLEYFAKLHPDFLRVKTACRQQLGIMARTHFANMIHKGDPAAVTAYLRKKHKLEWATANITQQLPGDIVTENDNPEEDRNAIVFIDFGNGSDPATEIAEAKETLELDEKTDYGPTR
jgi:hypothetical protein